MCACSCAYIWLYMHPCVHARGGQESPIGVVLLNANYLILRQGFIWVYLEPPNSTELTGQFAPEIHQSPHRKYKDLKHALPHLDFFTWVLGSHLGPSSFAASILLIGLSSQTS